MTSHGLLKISTLPIVRQNACLAAVKASFNSYSPYSGFCVGAALVHPDDTITAGTNWENCTYQGTCAERCAIVTANAIGQRAAVAVAVYGAVRGSEVKPQDYAITTPCGLCRQMLHEVGQLGGYDMDVMMVTRSQTHVHMVKLSTLLPSSFGPEDAGLDISMFKLPSASSNPSSPTSATSASALPVCGSSDSATTPTRSTAAKGKATSAKKTLSASKKRG